MQQGENVNTKPTTLVGAISDTLPFKVVIGNQWYDPTSGDVNSYMYVVISRKDLSVKERLVSTDNSAYPSELDKYLGDNMFYLYVLTRQLRSDNLPVGNLYNMLKSIGAGASLDKMIQTGQQLGTATYANVVYLLAADMKNDHTSGGFEQYTFFKSDAQIMTLVFGELQIGGETIWTLGQVGSV